MKNATLATFGAILAIFRSNQNFWLNSLTVSYPYFNPCEILAKIKIIHFRAGTPLIP